MFGEHTPFVATLAAIVALAICCCTTAVILELYEPCADRMVSLTWASWGTVTCDANQEIITVTIDGDSYMKCSCLKNE